MRAVKKFIKVVVTVSCFLVALTARPHDVADCDTTVWFVNIYPGEEIYELEGHSALRIKSCDFDVAINYGMFSFNSPNFVYRFVKGETDYMVGAIPWEYFLEEYRLAGRRTVAHKLDLTSSQKNRLLRLVENNLLPENRVYRYNYVLDNCSTRPLRMVELAVEDTLLMPEKMVDHNLLTFRDFMKFYHRNYPWYQFGIDLALGNGIDRPITEREKTFAPVVMEKMIDSIRIKGREGKKLVSEVTVINDTLPEGVVKAPTPFYLTPNFIFWGLAIVLTGYSFHQVTKRKKYPRILGSIVFGIYGLAGVLVTFLVFISVHEATSPNVNLLWLNPLCFIPVVCFWLKKAKRLNCLYFLLNFVLLSVLIALWVAGYQMPNPAFVPLVLIDLTLSCLYLYNCHCDDKKRKSK